MLINIKSPFSWSAGDDLIGHDSRYHYIPNAFNFCDFFFFFLNIFYICQTSRCIVYKAIPLLPSKTSHQIYKFT